MLLNGIIVIPLSTYDSVTYLLKSMATPPTNAFILLSFPYTVVGFNKFVCMFPKLNIDVNTTALLK